MKGKPVTAPDLAAIKARGEKISMLTAYDYPSGRLVDEAGIDIALVGDSLGMVVLGYDNTLQVTMEDMIRHTAAVSRGVKRALIAADMPFLSYQINDEEALRNAGRLIVEGGAHVVKLEGGERVAGTIRKIVDAGIPVIGHLGMTPQSVYAFGGFKEQGADPSQAGRIKQEALLLQESGVSAIVLEKIPAPLAAEITASIAIPTIGIGAGPDCDGQVLVMHDVLGLYDKFTPPFARQYAHLWQTTLEAFKTYNDEVKSGKFPGK
jgi:3-methyl-2-oxobutanoate hydroxymethyltransferase